MNIAEALKEKRTREGKTQAQAARDLDTSVRTYQEWEQGREPTSCAACERLLSYLLPCENGPRRSFLEHLECYRRAGHVKLTIAQAAARLSEEAGFPITFSALRSWLQGRRGPRLGIIIQLLPILREGNLRAQASARERARWPKLRRRRPQYATPQERLDAVNERLAFVEQELRAGRQSELAEEWSKLKGDLKPKAAKAVANAEAKKQRLARARRKPRRASPIFAVG